MQSEGAPVPVTGNRGSDLSRLGSGLWVLDVLRVGDGDTLGIHVVLDLAQAVGASLLPAHVSAPAEIAGTGRHAVWMEAGVLVQRDEVGSVGGAEDMAAVTTVVATKEDAKGRATGRGVAVGRSRVRLGGRVSIAIE